MIEFRCQKGAPWSQKGAKKSAPNLRCFCATLLITFGIVLAPKMKLFEPKVIKKRDVERGACEKGGIGVHMVKPTLLHRLTESGFRPIEVAFSSFYDCKEGGLGETRRGARKRRLVFAPPPPRHAPFLVSFPTLVSGTLFRAFWHRKWSQNRSLNHQKAYHKGGLESSCVLNAFLCAFGCPSTPKNTPKRWEGSQKQGFCVFQFCSVF